MNNGLWDIKKGCFWLLAAFGVVVANYAECRRRSCKLRRTGLSESVGCFVSEFDEASVEFDFVFFIDFFIIYSLLWSFVEVEFFGVFNVDETSEVVVSVFTCAERF
jgi:hypothetical protein